MRWAASLDIPSSWVIREVRFRRSCWHSWQNSSMFWAAQLMRDKPGCMRFSTSRTCDLMNWSCRKNRFALFYNRRDSQKKKYHSQKKAQQKNNKKGCGEFRSKIVSSTSTLTSKSPNEVDLFEIRLLTRSFRIGRKGNFLFFQDFLG